MSLTVLRVTRQNIVCSRPVSARQSRCGHFTRPCFRPQCHQQRCPGRERPRCVHAWQAATTSFFDVSIRDSHHFGVFMAHTETRTEHGWGQAPQTECTDNSFTNLNAARCGGAAFRVNNITCTNNVIIRAAFDENLKGGLSLPNPIW